MKRLKQSVKKSVLIGSVGGFTVGSVALARHFALKVVTPAKKAHEPITVTNIAKSARRDLITMTKGEDSGLSGELSLIFDGGSGHAIVGDIVHQNANTITRVLLKELEGDLRAGCKGRVTGWLYSNPQQLDLPVTDIGVPGELGSMPAWLFRDSENVSSHLMIHVHGRGSSKEETLRGVEPCSEAGVDSLVISYRNDAESPAALDGKYGLGTTEASDVASAIVFAKTLGYDKISIFAWSMGGAATLVAVNELQENNPNLASALNGLILESPAIDWPHILMHQAKRAKLPKRFARLGVWMIEKMPWLLGMHSAIHISKLTPDRFAEQLTLPTLLVVSPEDTFVPFEGALELAKSRNDLVRIYRAPGGEHVKIFNNDPNRWRSEVSAFIKLLATH